MKDEIPGPGAYIEDELTGPTYLANIRTIPQKAVAGSSP